ncbi:ABC transporter ATP-binding protein [Yeosuana sp. MJ-SS3]|uniref:ABC transporter ATP-binding protein n=1 Tax=Gilvirhabdus luticola TaxID=3079858 RepID=A0ABU3U2W3_9FLAO|nr:ABC transporter ATP-binding protein [Yeosuana sp. MJ-SS3]MDU8884737.1 ABC transporter ATP-binding protein [Yeosuana sp. MJ-SS3]
MLQVINISFGYKNALVLNNISFNVNAGEHVSIIGESGSGKSTLLKLIYGEFDLNNGQIFWNNIEVLGPKYNLIAGPEFMKYVAQEFDLMPYKTVEENIGEFLSNFYLNEKQKRINELLEVVELSSFSKTKVKLLSGGQKQRVALARAIAKQPEIILLDEPFSHIDNFKKQSLRRNLFSFLKNKNISCVVATHDKDDVLSYADSIIALDNGRVMAKDTPRNLFNNPKNSLIASFFGEYNVINGEIVYAHQLKIVSKSNLKAAVRHSYFNGTYYLIEVNFKGKSIFIENVCEINQDDIIHFEIFK